MTTVPDEPIPLQVVTPSTPEERLRAALAVCDRVTDADDAGRLLDMLGLREARSA